MIPAIGLVWLLCLPIRYLALVQDPPAPPAETAKTGGANQEGETVPEAAKNQEPEPEKAKDQESAKPATGDPQASGEPAPQTGDAGPDPNTGEGESDRNAEKADAETGTESDSQKQSEPDSTTNKEAVKSGSQTPPVDSTEEDDEAKTQESGEAGPDPKQDQVTGPETTSFTPPGEPVSGAETGDLGPLDPDLAELPPVVAYEIQAELDPERKQIIGQEVLTYTNHSPDLIGDLQFHLYLNAFKNTQSTYMRESGGPAEKGDEYWGYIQVQRAFVDGEPVEMSYLRKPDGAPGDQTVMGLTLNQPLLPGDSLTVSLDFEARLPRVFDRTGYERDFYLVAQWFPKIGVWETQGFRGAEEAGWNCRPFHANTEFYANFGSYRVTLDIPTEFKVGATGVLLDTEERGEVKRYTFEQDRIHDFAFTASPHFLRHVRTFEPNEWIDESEIHEIMDLHNLAREEVALPRVEMILLIQPDHRNQIDRHFNALAQAIKYFGLWYGPYPYPTVTMVDPGYGARAAGGMEYPTLITLGTHWRKPKDDLGLEDVTIHEFGHQYWYGMVASNEFEESWLDEGINSFSTNRILDKVYGPKPEYERLPLENPSFGHLRLPLQKWLGFENLSRKELDRISGLSGRGMDRIVRNGWEYRSGRSYGINSYPKPATMLEQLAIELGEPVMARVMRNYFRQWSFKHPSTKDFIQVVNETSGRDMNWFFDELFYKAGWLDYSVSLYRTDLDSAGYTDLDGRPVFRPGKPFDGAKESDEAKPPETEEGSAPESAEPQPATGERTEPDRPNRQEVWIENHGAVRYPVEILVEFEDDTRVVESWQGDYPWHRFVYDDAPRIREVRLDPQRRLFIDANRVNNAYLTRPDSRAARSLSLKLLLAVQNALQVFAGGL